MKRILLLAGILIAVSSVLQAQPKIKFEKETQELGYVLWRTPVTVTYHLRTTATSRWSFRMSPLRAVVRKRNGPKIRFPPAARAK